MLIFRVMRLVIDAGDGDGQRIGVVRYLHFTPNVPAFVLNMSSPEIVYKQF